MLTITDHYIHDGPVTQFGDAEPVARNTRMILASMRLKEKGIENSTSVNLRKCF